MPAWIGHGYRYALKTRRYGFLPCCPSVGRVTSTWIASQSDFFVSGREVSLVINACAIGGIGLAALFVASLPQFAITFGFFPAYLFGLMWGLFSPRWGSSANLP